MNNELENMQTRRIWALREFYKNLNDDFKDKVQLDNDLLLWIYEKESNLWFSVNGNYSAKSPKQKEEQEIKRLKEYGEAYLKRLQYDLEKDLTKKAILKRDNYTCQMCGTHKTPMNQLHIHHIKPERMDGEYSVDNLVTVCKSCHHRNEQVEYSYEERKKYEHSMVKA